MDSLSLSPLLLMMMQTSKNGNGNGNGNGNDNNNYMFYITIITIILPFLSRFIPFNEIKDKLWDYFEKVDNKVSITITSHEVPIMKGYSQTAVTKLVYSKSFLALVHHLTTKNFSLNSLTEIMTNNSELNIPNYYEEERIKDTNQFMLLPLYNKQILLSSEHQIYCEMNDIDNKEKENKNEDEDKKKTTVAIAKKKNYIIILSIQKNNKNNEIQLLQEFIKNCVDEYELLSRKKDNKQYIYEYKNCEKSESDTILHFDTVLMEHNKDLNTNIFFENKKKLLNYIDPFIYDPFETVNVGEQKYKRSGFTFKAGLLFYGYPGCGKTSTIKAILKHTNRHGIIVNLNNIKTCEELQNIFRKRRFSQNELTGKQICYILEDCDATDDNKSIVQSREKKENEDIKKNIESPDAMHLAKLIEFSATTVVGMSSLNNDSVTLSCFLNILDGIIELHGVMIIMTTNYPERIDEALIRPGRFDFKYEFKKASKNIIKQMLQFKYELSDMEIDKYTEHMNIKDEILSPAEVQSICFQNDNIEDCIDCLIFASQK